MLVEDNVQQYQLEQDGLVYRLNTSLLGPHEDLRFFLYEVLPMGNSPGFEAVYTINDLRNINPVFKLIPTCEDAQWEIERTILEQNVGVVDEDEFLYLILYMTLNGKRARIPLSLKWLGPLPRPCRIHGIHNPDRVAFLENETQAIIGEQFHLQRQIDSLLGRPLTSSIDKVRHALIPDLGPPPISDIILNQDDYKMLQSKISNTTPPGRFNLIYKASRDGDSAAAFHSKCDGAGRTVVLIRAKNGKRFGGYTTQNWSGDKIEKIDPYAFVFSLDKNETYDIITGQKAIGCYKDFGPVFMGCQIRVMDQAFTKGGTTFTKEKNYFTPEDFILAGEQKFGIDEIEVFEIV